MLHNSIGCALVVLAGASSAVAQVQGPIGESLPPIQPAAAHVLIDCPPGPGWLRLTVVDPWGRFARTSVETISEADCRAQAEVLRPALGTVLGTQVFGVCTICVQPDLNPLPKDWSCAKDGGTYMHRWQVDMWGGFHALPTEEYGNRPQCLQDAKDLVMHQEG